MAPVWAAATLLLIVLIPAARIPFLGSLTDWARIFFFAAFWLLRFTRTGLRGAWTAGGRTWGAYFFFFTAFLFLNFWATDDPLLWAKSALIHLLAFAYYYYFLEFAADSQRRETVLLVFVATAGAVGALAVLQAIVLYFKLDLGPFQRLVLSEALREAARRKSSLELVPLGYRSIGTFYHPNLLGMYLALSFPVAASFAVMGRGAVRAIARGALVLILAGALTSGSRGFFLNAAVGGAVLVFLTRGVLSKTTLAACAAVVVALLAAFYARQPEYFRLTHVLSSRDVIWDHAASLFLERPWTGFGLGSFSQEYFSRFGFPSANDLQSQLPEIVLAGDLHVLAGFHAHNIFLQYATEGGVIGAALALLFMALAGRFAWTLRHRESFLAPADSVVAVAGISALAGHFAQGLVEGVTLFYNLSLGLSLALVLACVRRALYPSFPGR